MKKIILSIFCAILFSFSAKATVHVVNVSNFMFTPSALTINCNDTVQFHWINGTHPVVSETATWSTFTMSAGLTDMYIPLATAGTYAYYCDFHGGVGGVGMSGTITVTCGGGDPCPQPTGLMATSITSTSANISWNPVPGVIKYQLQYKPGGPGTWTKKLTTTNSKVIGPLTPSTTYVYKVIAACDGARSDFSTTLSFTTLAFDDGIGEETKQSEPMDMDHSMHSALIGLYPNPNAGTFQLVLDHIDQGEAPVQIFDLSGKLIYENTFNVQDMSVVEYIQLPDGFTGAAIVKVHLQDQELVRDIIVQ
ncbi:MAG: fibronectin type III domain-containing protein [Chitinophagales bacterium]